MNQVIDKTVLISGASSGIGEATLRELANKGARLFIGARRTDRLEALAAELGSNVAWYALDVTDAASFAAFTDAAEERFGRVDVLVNNAGVMPLSPLAALKQDEWARMIDVNIRGVLNGIRGAAALRGAAIGPCRQRRFHRRAHGDAECRRLLRDQIRGVGDHRRAAAGA